MVAKRARVVRLSPRESQVSQMVAQGMSNKAIAKALRLSELTVKDHVKAIGRKLTGPGKPRHRITVFFLQIDQPDSGSDPNI